MSDAVIKSAGRVFEILELFRSAKKPLSVREIAEHFGYPISSTTVLLKSIATLGYLAYDSDEKAYFPSVRVALLGDWVWESKFSHGTLVTLVDDLVKELGHTAILAVQNDIYAQYVYIARGTDSIQFYAPEGSRRLLCSSGTGWALLSGASDEAVARQVQRSNARMDKASQVTIDFVMGHVEEARRLGYAFSRHVVNKGVGAIAVPILVNGMVGQYAIAVAGMVEQLEEREQLIAKTLAKFVKAYG